MEYTHNSSKSCWLHRWNTRGLIWHATKLWSALSVKLHAILFVWTHTIAHYLTLGVEDYLKPVDGDVWIQAMREESIDMPAFYPGWFGKLADKVLLDSWGMQRCNITPENWRNVYINLVNYFPLEYQSWSFNNNVSLQILYHIISTTILQISNGDQNNWH